MLVRIKYTRNGLNTTKDLKNTKRPHLMKRCQKTQNVLLAAKTVSKTQKASRCETVKSPLGGASQRNGVENPKRFECTTPFEFNRAFAVFIPLRVCV